MKPQEMCVFSLFIVVFHVQGDPGLPGFKGEAGPKGELVSVQPLTTNHLL